MQKRQQLVLDDAYHDFERPGMAEAYARQSYDLNRADSIEWARRRCQDDPEIRDFIFGLRRQFRTRLARDFPKEVVLPGVLADSEDPNHFFVLVGRFAETSYSEPLRQMVMFFCKQLRVCPERLRGIA